jgi:transposase InsO family protein
MSLRLLIATIETQGLNVTGFCHDHGISTWSFYEIRRRFRSGGVEALEPRSRAPHRIANRLAVEVEDQIVAIRKELTDAGLDAGADTILWSLERIGIEPLPSRSTVYRTLKTRGLVVAEPAKAPKHAGRTFVAERANECWQLDDTTWMLIDGTEAKNLNVVDDHSRHAVASKALETVTGASALETVLEAGEVLGLPARVQSDNAKAFRHVLADALRSLGVATTHSRPHHPQTNGKVERFHQTQKRWLARQPRAATIAELQAQLDQFRLVYNHRRPHRALDRRFPADVWTTAPKTGPANRPLGEPTTLYTGIVHRGQLRLGNRWRISLGHTHSDQPAIAAVTGTNCHVFVNGRLARTLTLNPERVDQPRRLP